LLLLFIACNKKENTKTPNLVDSTSAATDTIREGDDYTPRKESINLFTLTYRDSTDAAFVSLSDIYPLSGNDEDTLALPEIKKMSVKDANYFILEKKYKNRFFSKTNISETDSLFVYDYNKNKLVSFAVKNLKAAALINGYTSEQDFPYDRYNYMIGFEISKEYLKGFTDYYTDVLVYVGKENPFSKEPLTPIVWKKIAGKEYPSKPIKTKDHEQLKNKVMGNTYVYKTASYNYFLQDYLDSRKDVDARRLLVLDAKTNDVIIEKIYGESEGTSPSPLNYQNSDNIINQYTGKLFKDKPPVVFGFLYESFGCPAISLIDKSNEDIYIQCDYRH
jgi:hypothetical protein